ncbi:ribonuclease domain-containing protein [Nocardioides malaquae]|uniref:ribonuclease domain-containing protein n=1 Tax=Nocardioides malaquae TaxID=2773426 RepID=UPI0029D410D4|nr:ribonuclease domain-containing protein [Nocardioides malaquae]
MVRRAPFTLVAALLVGLVLWWSQTGGGSDSLPWTTETAEAPAPQVEDRGPSTIGPADPGLPSVRLADLPPEAAEVVAQIDAGGPFAHPEHDGSRFGNYEGLLPNRPRGHYREYTVPTPGIDHRGARRIVTGDPEEMYWTDDHYQSFSRILR